MQWLEMQTSHIFMKLEKPLQINSKIFASKYNIITTILL